MHNWGIFNLVSSVLLIILLFGYLSMFSSVELALSIDLAVTLSFLFFFLIMQCEDYMCKTKLSVKLNALIGFCFLFLFFVFIVDWCFSIKWKQNKLQKILNH